MTEYTGKDAVLVLAEKILSKIMERIKCCLEEMDSASEAPLYICMQQVSADNRGKIKELEGIFEYVVEILYDTCPVAEVEKVRKRLLEDYCNK